MFPVQSLKDFHRYHEMIKTHVDYDYYCFILYKTGHEDFRNYILNAFNRIHEYSGNLLIVMIDQAPPAWLEQMNPAYYQQIINDENEIQLDDEEVDSICRQFGLNAEGLPYVIFFTDFDKQDFNQFCFRGTDGETVIRFFESVLDLASKAKFQGLDFLRIMKHLRDQFPELKTESSYIVDGAGTIRKALEASSGSAGVKAPEDIPVEYFERTKPRKTRHSTKIKEQVRLIAKDKWEQDASITVKDMAFDDDINRIAVKLDGSNYTEEIIQRWLANLRPTKKL